MQKIELTNKQYRLLLQLVALGVDMIDNAALGDDDDEEEEENDEGSALLNDATDLEDFLMAQSKRFGIKDIIRYDADEDYLEYTGPFMEEHEMIAHSAYFNKTAEIASFRLGMRDYKEVNGTDALENVNPDVGADKIMSFSLKYLNEIFENGFDNFYLNTEGPAKIINLSPE